MSDVIARESSQQKIQQGSLVSLHFSLHLSGGEEIDTTRRGQPAALAIGDGNLLPGFENALLGLQAGDDMQVVVPAKDAFGEHNEANVRLLAREQFAELDQANELEPGLIISFQAADGELPGVVQNVYAETVKIDFNHPLSGKDILFDVSILSVTEADAVDPG